MLATLAGCGQGPSHGSSAPLTTSPTIAQSSTPSSSSNTLVEGAKQYSGTSNLKKWETVANSHPNNWLDQIQAGRAGFANQSAQTAIHYYKAAIRIDPKQGLSYNNLGNIYDRLLHKYTMAQVYYAKATQTDPSYDYGWYNYSYVEIQLGHKAQAIQIAKQAMAALPATDPLRPYLAKIASGKG